MDNVRGIARVVDTRSNAKLEVSFVRFLGRNWFWGDYWIIGLDSEYRWAIVGTPSRKYGWILCRAPEMEAETRRQVNEILTRQGYQVDVFVDTTSE